MILGFEKQFIQDGLCDDRVQEPLLVRETDLLRRESTSIQNPVVEED